MTVQPNLDQGLARTDEAYLGVPEQVPAIGGEEEAPAAVDLYPEPTSKPTRLEYAEADTGTRIPGLMPEADPPPSDVKAEEQRQVQEALSGWYNKTRVSVRPPQGKGTEDHLSEFLRQGAERFFGGIAGAVTQYEQEGTYNPAPIMEGVATVAGVNAPFMAGRAASAGIFGGRLSPKTVQEADTMMMAGETTGAIKSKTGLELGADGAWRNEISDHASKITLDSWSKNARKVDDGNGGMISYGKLEHLLHHDTLYKEYPELKKVNIRFEAEPEGGALGLADPSKNTIILKKGLNEDQAHEVLIHEIQHMVQAREGFSFSVPEEFKGKFGEELRNYFLQKNYSKQQLQTVWRLEQEGKIDKAKSLAKQLMSHADYELYLHQATEVEARNAARRLKMSPEDRVLIPGYATEEKNIPRSEQIVKDKLGIRYGTSTP